MGKYDPLVGRTPNSIETDAIISLVTQRAIPDGRERVGALLNNVCSLIELPGSVSSRPFAPIAREFFKQKFPVFQDVNEKTLDTQLDAEEAKGPLSESKANEIVTSWLQQERTRLKLAEFTEVPPISASDGPIFELLQAGKKNLSERILDARRASGPTASPT